MKANIGTLALLLMTSCLDLQPPEADLIPPSVVEFLPQGEDVNVDTRMTVLFSEIVAISPGDDSLVVVLPADQLDGEFLDDLNKPPLSSKHSMLTVACRVERDLEGMRIELEPDQALEEGQAYNLVVSAAVTDLSGNSLVDELRYDENGRLTGTRTHILHSFSTLAGGILMTEVLANPEGPESEGEYLEIFNRSRMPIDLTDWRLDDEGGAGQGDLLGACSSGQVPVIGSGAVALLVGQSFIRPVDLAPDTLLICSDHASLTPRGLRNTGDEVLVLKDANGAEIDRYGGWVDMSNQAGCAATRLSLSEPDSQSNWAIPESDPCRTPGWIE
ncbi:MAG: lamin tail domain-containing protein [Deltaproteobacteria bacterium]|nr:lamin tail domain-containing protein [Deltaproteobacteria bacterium]MBW1870946.1 lamin tail domain-containing protein [Deltaproteobacteria bacterium]